MKYWLLVLLFLLGGCASTGGNESTGSTPTVASAESTESDEGDEIICVREKQVGSHFSRRVCRTKREMEELRRESVDMMDRTSAIQDSTTPVE
ncbi:MAG: hypothetical protein HUJ31_03850 [Pseudomonadales bacterium]|nr:hypothetical protein [Pseudomonadales bacterium]